MSFFYYYNHRQNNILSNLQGVLTFHRCAIEKFLLILLIIVVSLWNIRIYKISIFSHFQLLFLLFNFMCHWKTMHTSIKIIQKNQTYSRDKKDSGSIPIYKQLEPNCFLSCRSMKTVLHNLNSSKKFHLLMSSHLLTSTFNSSRL